MENIISNIVADFEQGKISRRTLISSLAVTAAAATVAAPVLGADARPLKVTSINHLSYGVADYARTRDFYADLLGMKVSADDGKQCTLGFGNTTIIARKTKQPDNKPYIDHVAYTIDNWDEKAVEAELKRRNLNPPPVSGDSFMIKDPDGFPVQLSKKT